MWHYHICRFGSCNVHRALCEAMAMKSPAYAFPVADLDTLTSVDKYKGEFCHLYLKLKLLPGFKCGASKKHSIGNYFNYRPKKI